MCKNRWPWSLGALEGCLWGECFYSWRHYGGGREVDFEEGHTPQSVYQFDGINHLEGNIDMLQKQGETRLTSEARGPIGVK